MVGGKRPGAGRKTARKPPRENSGDGDGIVSDLISDVTSALSAAHSFLRHHDLLLLPSQTLTLESHLSKSNRSLSDLSSLILPTAGPPPPAPSPASNCWFHRLLSSAGHDSQWPELFRMSKPTFSLLLSSLTPALESSLPPSIPASYALSAAVYRLAHSAPYPAVARRFGLSPSDACRAFFTVCKVICDQLGELFEFRSDLERIVLGFGWISLPNCFGILGASQFPVSGELLGANGFLIVQALVDSEGRFLDVSAGWPSTMKPDVVLAQSKLFHGVEGSKELLNGPEFKLIDGNLVPQYVIGDCCYPLLPWLLTPYAGNGLSFEQMVFNEVHRGLMGLFRKAFARVRVLWRLLDRQWKEECVEFLPFVIVTCCLLYNFLIKHGEPLPDVNEAGVEEEEAVSGCDGDDSVQNEDAKRVRDVIALHLSRVSQRR